MSRVLSILFVLFIGSCVAVGNNQPQGPLSSSNPPPASFFNPNATSTFSPPPNVIPYGTLPPNAGANGTNPPPPKSPKGVHVDGFYFPVRDIMRVDVDPLVVKFIEKYCNVPNCLNNSLVKSFLTEVAEFVLIESFDASAVYGAGEFDLLMHMLAFPGNDSLVNDVLNTFFGISIYPSTATAYFSATSQYVPGAPYASLNISAHGFAIQHTYTHIIEYKDLNGNKVYDFGEAVQIIDLSLVPWNPPLFRTINVNNYTVHEVFIQTTDGVASFLCHTSNYPVYDQNSILIHPNKTKCDHLIQNFPYTQNGTFLAVHAQAVLSGGQFQGTVVNGSIGVTPTDPAHFIGGHFHWADSIVVNGVKYPVIANVSSQVSIDQVKDFTSKFITLQSGPIGVDVRNVTFSFLTPPNAASIHWDPEVAYGQDTNLASTSTSTSTSSPSSSPSNSPTSSTNSASSLVFSFSAIFVAFVASLLF